MWPFDQLSSSMSQIGNVIGQNIADNFKSAAELNQFNADQIAEQRAWEKMMSDTAIQRRVADIKAAGLNPWLALNGGSIGEASTPSSAYQRYDSSAEARQQQLNIKLMDNLVKVLLGLTNSASKVISSGLGAGGNAAKAAAIAFA